MVPRKHNEKCLHASIPICFVLSGFVSSEHRKYSPFPSIFLGSSQPYSSHTNICDLSYDESSFLYFCAILFNVDMKEILYVGIGSCLGGVARYIVSSLFRHGGGFPWGTFVVNLCGCFLIGLLAGVFSRNASQPLNLLLTVGFCGGFTTFSTFSRESLVLVQSGQWLTLVAYVGLSVIIGVALTAIGYALAKGAVLDKLL